jgi:hypothetical protein
MIGEQFYLKVVNNTNISSSEDELQLLNRGLKCNLNQKRKHWLSNLALEAETAITLLPTHEQEHIRYRVAHSLQNRYKQHSNRRTVPDITTKSETRTIKHINKKLIDNNVMITKADKGNSNVILYTVDYNNKVDNFIISNNFTSSKMGITNTLQRDIRTAVNEYQTIIPKDKKWRYIALDPAAPNMRGLLKIH